jgi:hypothetical protein
VAGAFTVTVSRVAGPISAVNPERRTRSTAASGARDCYNAVGSYGGLYSDDIQDERDTLLEASYRTFMHSSTRANVRDRCLITRRTLPTRTTGQTAAAFANSFGGLIIFGVEGKDDEPRRMTGFDPRGVEIKTKLTRSLLSRIQPRPDFRVRITNCTDQAKEVVVLRFRKGPIRLICKIGVLAGTAAKHPAFR